MATMTVVKCPCGTMFKARTADVNRGWGKFCSKSCKTTFAKSTPAPVCSNCHGSGQDPGLPFLDCEVCNVFAAPMVSMSAPEQQLGQHLCSDQACECGGTGVIDAKGDKLEIADRHLERMIEHSDDLQQRLTVAEQRSGKLESLLPNAELALKALNVAVSVYDVELADNARRGLRELIAALKPAEEATGSTCNQIREESGLPTKNPCVACNNGACIDR